LYEEGFKVIVQVLFAISLGPFSSGNEFDSRGIGFFTCGISDGFFVTTGGVSSRSTGGSRGDSGWTGVGWIE
jgi:hypothetical protein